MPPKRSGAPYRRIVISFWNDPDVKNVLSPEEKLFAAYLFTNEHSHPCGVYGLRPIYVLDELGFSLEQMQALLAGPISKFVTYDWRTEEIFVHAMAEHQIDGNGLHGKDRRIGWVTTQLQMIHSRDLLRAFRARYGDWNLPWDEILPPSKDGASDGQAKGDTMGHDMPLGKPHNHAEKEGASQGASEASASPSFQPTDPVGSNNPPASSGDSKGGKAGSGSDHEHDPRGTHPGTEALWRGGGLMGDVHRIWHHGVERVVLPGGKDVGLGLEYTLVSDLLWILDGDAQEAAWLIREAPGIMPTDGEGPKWDAEPKSLYWLLRTQNLDQARDEYRRRHPSGPSSVDVGVSVRKIPTGGPPSEAQAEARRKLEQARSAS